MINLLLILPILGAILIAIFPSQKESNIPKKIALITSAIAFLLV